MLRSRKLGFGFFLLKQGGLILLFVLSCLDKLFKQIDCLISLSALHDLFRSFGFLLIRLEALKNGFSSLTGSNSGVRVLEQLLE